MQPAKKKALLDALRSIGESEFWIEDLEIEGFRKLFDLHRRVFNGYAEAMAGSHVVKPIPFLFLNRSVFNAVAFRQGEHTFIGMNWGTVILLYDLFLRLLASPSVLTHVGDVSLEKEHVKLPKLEIDAATLPHNEGVPFGVSVGPACEARTEYAHFLTQVALDFLFVHEHQHAAGGHLGYSADRCQRMAEIQDDAAFGDALTRHVLEFEADAAATNFSLKIACDMRGNAWRINDAVRPFLSTLDSRLNAWMFAVITLFMILEQADSLRLKSNRLSTHPSPILMRAFLTTIVFARQGPFSEPEDALALSASVLNAVHQGIRAVTLEPLSTRFSLELIAPSRNAHMLALGAQWRRMHPILERLGAPTGTRPAPKDLIEFFISS